MDLVLHSRLGLVAFYLRQALKVLDKFTPEQVESLPPFAEACWKETRETIQREASFFDMTQTQMSDAANQPSSDTETQEIRD